MPKQDQKTDNPNSTKNCTWDAIIKAWQSGDLDTEHINENISDCKKAQQKVEPESKG